MWPLQLSRKEYGVHAHRCRAAAPGGSLGPCARRKVDSGSQAGIDAMIPIKRHRKQRSSQTTIYEAV